MKTTYKTAAQTFFLLAALLPAAAQMEIAPDHFADDNSTIAAAPRLMAKVQTLQGQMEDCERQLQQKSDMVEKARQEAISAAALGDSAAAYIDVYRQQEMELETLKAALTPKMDQTRKIIAGLDAPANFR
jgi:uncharacterized protein YukE